MTTKRLGLYVHIPFCVKKCNYCDFCSFNLSGVDWREAYIDRLIEEIDSYRDRALEVDSVFFGGGTPTLLRPSELERIVDHIKESFVLSSDSEFTVESNPKTLDREKLELFRKIGVNRLSMGLQSIHENELKILGRIHSYEDFVDSYRLARECGIQNVNIDVMYGIPEQTIESFGKTLDAVLELKPDHVSVYGLILEEGTPFFEKKNELPLPSEDGECDMYYLAADRFRRAGYSHYEISNYALPGFECRHNLKYWRCEEYIGVGLSAYSYFMGERFGNIDIPSEYLSSDCVKYNQIEAVDAKAASYEYVMLRLRLKEGFSLSEYKSAFGFDFCKGRQALLSRLQEAGYISLTDDRISLTEQGFYISNSILTELI